MLTPVSSHQFPPSLNSHPCVHACTEARTSLVGQKIVARVLGSDARFARSTAAISLRQSVRPAALMAASIVLLTAGAAAGLGAAGVVGAGAFVGGAAFTSGGFVTGGFEAGGFTMGTCAGEPWRALAETAGGPVTAAAATVALVLVGSAADTTCASV